MPNQLGLFSGNSNRKLAEEIAGYLDMRLGEGTGALLAMPIIHAALSLFGMASFSQAGVSGAPPIS